MCRVGAKVSAGGVALMRSRVALPVVAFLNVALLTGCITGYEKPDTALEVPDKYRYANNQPDKALPSLDWWRGFNSKELTGMVEAAQTANLDIAVAVARIQQADAQARISGSALLPT